MHAVDLTDTQYFMIFRIGFEMFYIWVLESDHLSFKNILMPINYEQVTWNTTESGIYFIFLIYLFFFILHPTHCPPHTVLQHPLILSKGESPLSIPSSWHIKSLQG